MDFELSGIIMWHLSAGDGSGFQSTCSKSPIFIHPILEDCVSLGYLAKAGSMLKSWWIADRVGVIYNNPLQGLIKPLPSKEGMYWSKLSKMADACLNSFHVGMEISSVYCETQPVSAWKEGFLQCFLLWRFNRGWSLWVLAWTANDNPI